MSLLISSKIVTDLQPSTYFCGFIICLWKGVLHTISLTQYFPALPMKRFILPLVQTRAVLSCLYRHALKASVITQQGHHLYKVYAKYLVTAHDVLVVFQSLTRVVETTHFPDTSLKPSLSFNQNKSINTDKGGGGLHYSFQHVQQICSR